MNLSDMETQYSPYRPPLTSEQGRSLTPRWLPHLAGALAVLSAVVFTLLLVLKPDIEQYLADSMPGNHMPDAFDHLNRSIPIFFALMTISLALLFAITLKERYSLIVPLLAGPMIASGAWLFTENFQDPNWFHFVATSSMGMLVSCLATSFLAILPTKSTELTAARRELAERSDN